MKRWVSLSLAAFLVVAAAGLPSAQTAERGHGEEAFNSRLVGAHDLQGRSAYQFVVSESVANRCQETRHVSLMLDITDEARPLPIGTFQVPEASGDFCDRGGCFGPHAPQWSMEPPFYGRLMVVSWFNAGARVIDVRDPFNMAEVAYYIPATTERTAERCATIDGVETCQVAIQTNKVEVDDRGLIYLADRADTGLHIVELTGPAAAIINPAE